MRIVWSVRLPTVQNRPVARTTRGPSGKTSRRAAGGRRARQEHRVAARVESHAATRCDLLLPSHRPRPFTPRAWIRTQPSALASASATAGSRRLPPRARMRTADDARRRPGKRRARVSGDLRARARRVDDPRLERDLLARQPGGPVAVEALGPAQDPLADLLGDARAAHEAGAVLGDERQHHPVLVVELLLGLRERLGGHVDLADVVQLGRLAHELGASRARATMPPRARRRIPPWPRRGVLQPAMCPSRLSISTAPRSRTSVAADCSAPVASAS